MGSQMVSKMFPRQSRQGVFLKPNKSRAGSSDIHPVKKKLIRYVPFLCLIFFLPACGAYVGYGRSYPYDGYYPYGYSYPYYYYPYYSYRGGYYYSPYRYRARHYHRPQTPPERLKRPERREGVGRPSRPPAVRRGIRLQNPRGVGRGQRR